MKHHFLGLLLTVAAFTGIAIPAVKAATLTDDELVECGRRDLKWIAKWDGSDFAQFKMFMPSKMVSMYFDFRKQNGSDPFVERVRTFETCGELRKAAFAFTAERHHELRRKYSYPLKPSTPEMLDDFVDWSSQLKQSDIDASHAMVIRLLQESGYTGVARTMTKDPMKHRFVRSLAIQAETLRTPLLEMVRNLKIAGSPGVPDADDLDAAIFAILLRGMKNEIEANLDSCDCNWNSARYDRK